jgi:dihydrofolate reductase
MLASGTSRKVGTIVQARTSLVTRARCSLAARRTRVLLPTGSPLKDDWANLINPKPKYVASRTLEGPLEWNATLLERDATDAVSRLKAELPSDLLIYGCGELARSLLATALVDELRFWVHPAVWGSGERPLQGEAQNRLRLLGSQAFDSGVTLLRYAPARDVSTSPRPQRPLTEEAG